MSHSWKVAELRSQLRSLASYPLRGSSSPFHAQAFQSIHKSLHTRFPLPETLPSSSHSILAFGNFARTFQSSVLCHLLSMAFPECLLIALRGNEAVTLVLGSLCARPASTATCILYYDQPRGRFKTLTPLLESWLACGANDNAWLPRLSQPRPCSFCCDH